jgi:hypothetical protein
MVSLPGTGVDPLVPQNVMFIYFPEAEKKEVFCGILEEGKDPLLLWIELRS